MPENRIPIPRNKPASFPAGARFCPSYRVGSRTGLDRCLIHDDEYVDDVDPDNAARIADDRRLLTELGGLYFDNKVVVVKPTGIACVHGQVGPFTVLYIEGPIFESVKAENRQLMAKLNGVRIPAAQSDTKVEDA